MKSYPSSFSKDPLVQKGLVGANLKQTLKNIAGAAMNNMLGGDSQDDKEKLEENLVWHEYDYNANLAKMNYTNYNTVSGPNSTRLFITSSNRSVYENANKIPAFVLASINKYRQVYSYATIQQGNTTIAGEEKNGKVEKSDKGFSEIYQEGISPSLFNPWFGVRAQGFITNTPLMYLKNETDANINFMDKDGKDQVKRVHLNNANPDFTDCSIKTLVKLSAGKDENNPGELGRATYRYADFMYCKELGKISNNHLITLRKFTHPIGDNIYAQVGIPGEAQMLPDQGRLVTWFGTEDNKLEDICKFNYSTTWKELNSEIMDVQSKEDNGKIVPSIVNIMNSPYREGAFQGYWGDNFIYNKIQAATGDRLFSATSAEASDPDRYYLDKNKIWTPPNTIQSTHIYEGKIQFSHSFTLTFNYELRSYDGINPKSAFLDLIGNILEVTFKRGTFWGGKHRWLGAPRNTEGWKKMNDLFAKGEAAAHEGLEALFGCGGLDDIANLCSQAFKSLGNLVSGAIDKVKEAASDGSLKEGAKKVAHGAVHTLTGMLKNKLGRPAVYAMDSLLNDSNVGLWHVTIGNPRNPILSMGNLILEDAEIQHYGVLGIDDFPTGLKVTVKLKHAKPRDITTIASMYTCGQGGLLLPLNGRGIDNFIDINTDKVDLGLGGLSNDVINGDKPEASMINTMWANLG